MQCNTLVNKHVTSPRWMAPVLSLSDSETGLTIQRNLYDARTFRVSSTEYGGGSPTQTRHFYYSSGWQCLEDRLDASSSADRQFVWGLRYIDDLVLRDRGDERLYAIQDANWNVTSVVDNSGNLVERFMYTAYGLPVLLTPEFDLLMDTDVDWETLYCAYRFDSTSRFYVVRQRIFTSALGAWLTQDPGGYIDSINLYEYVVGAPLSATDPSGMYWFHVYKDFTDSSFNKVMAAIGEIRQQAPVIEAEITKELAALPPCMLKKLKPDLERLKKVISKLIDDIDSPTVKLWLVEQDLKDDSWAASRAARGVYNNTLYFNTRSGASGKLLFDMNQEYISTKIFHELTHLYGTTDDGEMNNAHQIEKLMTPRDETLPGQAKYPPLKAWGLYRALRNKAAKECSCPLITETPDQPDFVPFRIRERTKK